MNKTKQILEDAAKTYNEFKIFEGKKYTGMRVGGRHKWYYEKGEWNEKKVTPDRWEFSYAVPKRRAGHALLIVKKIPFVLESARYSWVQILLAQSRKLNRGVFHDEGFDPSIHHCVEY